MPTHAVDRPFQFSLRQLLFVVVAVSVLLAVGVPLYRLFRRDSERRQCRHNLTQIAVALHTYHDTWKVFPPVMWTDQTGKPMHSWRVLIWPQIESSPYFSQYNFNEPWDGPKNRKLHGVYAFLWRCPSDRKTAPEMTRTNFK